MVNDDVRFIDLFGGIGGFRLGLEKSIYSWIQQGQDWEENNTPQKGTDRNSENTVRKSAGFRCVAYYDIDKYATAVYNYNFKEAHKPADITKVKSEDIPDFDLLCGGFPCQSFSIAGKRRGFEDTRGTLFFEIARILRDKQPKMVFLENVAGLLSHDEGRTFGTILDTLRELGYVGQGQVLNSKNFGVPQNRERVFIVGHLGERSPPKIFPIGEDGENINGKNGKGNDIAHTIQCSDKARGSYIRQEINNRVYGENIISPSLNTMQGGNRQPKILATQLFNLNMQGRRQKDEGEPSFTCDTLGSQGVTIGTKIRRLTPIECERLQGYPDNWTKYGIIDNKITEMSDTQRYKMCGNSVTVNVIEAIATEFNKPNTQAENKLNGE